MSKKIWIGIKRGLIREPKHRIAMGACVWLFQYMVDIADWDTGVIVDWKDEAAADDMQMPIRTLREQRRKLEELDYVACSQKQYGQEIAIMNWSNPREFSGDVYNKKQSGKEASPPETGQGYTQGYTQGSTKDVTPTSNSDTIYQAPRKKFRDATWDILHGQNPTEEGLELARRAELYTNVADRLSAGLRRGEFPQNTEAQKTYRWIAEREAEGQSLSGFITWAMEGKRAEFSFVYHKDPSLIKRDWLQVYTSANTTLATPDKDGGFR